MAKKNKTQRILERDGCIVVNHRDSLQHGRRRYLESQRVLGKVTLKFLSNDLLCYSLVELEHENTNTERPKQHSGRFFWNRWWRKLRKIS